MIFVFVLAVALPLAYVAALVLISFLITMKNLYGWVGLFCWPFLGIWWFLKVVLGLGGAAGSSAWKKVAVPPALKRESAL